MSHAVLNTHKTALATRCLWSLQETETSMDGLLLVTTSGLVMAATLEDNERVQRLAALSAALYLLGIRAALEFRQDEASEVIMKLYDEPTDAVHIVRFLPVTDYALLVVIYCSTTDTDDLPDNAFAVIDYLSALLNDRAPLPDIRW